MLQRQWQKKKFYNLVGKKKSFFKLWRHLSAIKSELFVVSFGFRGWGQIVDLMKPGPYSLHSAEHTFKMIKLESVLKVWFIAIRIEFFDTFFQLSCKFQKSNIQIEHCLSTQYILYCRVQCAFWLGNCDIDFFILRHCQGRNFQILNQSKQDQSVAEDFWKRKRYLTKYNKIVENHSFVPWTFFRFFKNFDNQIKSTILEELP